MKRGEAEERPEASILTVPKRRFCPEFQVADIHVPLQLTWRARCASDAGSLPEVAGGCASETLRAGQLG